MAKGLRSSSKKANRTKLRSRVFAPVEKARAERLHAKLLETIQQEKPEAAKKSDMDVDKDSTNTTEAIKEDDFPKGSSYLTAAIPRSLCEDTITKLDPAQEDLQMRNLCFHLGLCSDILGFSDEGHLKFAFDPLPPHWLNMDVDAAASAAKKSSKKDDRKVRKPGRARKPQNSMTFPKSRGKGALKPFTGGRVNKRR
ncbi:hypothetical protein P153DRAFT_293130 [Dothidotthia symphoricarpi CBS 119687]|uniref:DUF2423 domain-containing protein n=1 Tax=Dothidotthia symphoricarpi CBS 119687 TaxID=1392245 RepID=A0A6A6AC30_9PLEO|nr:uncharacterized protein P153DRAFT_293130 [Dothidotthia symphoricarpi CBS 119687]KAF2128564.1 hypothetical protein P153DRAFT_293130 [Dothidotthia symphoricarpi CBS 119687]